MAIDLDKLIKKANRNRASDLHLRAGSAPIMRIDGVLTDMAADKLSKDAMHQFRKTVLDSNEQKKLKNNGSVDTSYTVDETIRLRVSVYEYDNGYGLALRIIPSQFYTFSELGLPSEIKTICSKTRGLVLVTGPTGSGKSTTLSSFINHINQTYKRHIVTLEDPIERLHEDKKSIITQRELGDGLVRFADGIRAGLRMDPDVMMVGEMRDEETISTALTAAETGHLVFSTLHTVNASETLHRIIDTFPERKTDQIRSQLSGVISAVLSQTLVPHASGDGRVPAFEILLRNNAISNMIREGKEENIKSAIGRGREEGMRTLEQHLSQLVKNGSITKNNALKAARDEKSLNNLI